MHKIKKYNPIWEKYLLPYLDGISPYLPDYGNMELDYSDVNIQSSIRCIVGEIWKFSNDYTGGSEFCYECHCYSIQLEFMYYRDVQERHKQNSDILSSFKYYLAKLYEHVEESHNDK